MVDRTLSPPPPCQHLILKNTAPDLSVEHRIYRRIDVPIHSPCFPFFEFKLADDHELVQRVTARLQCRLGSPVCNFQIAGREDGLILRGQVKTYYGKQLAQEVVMEVSGLSIMANDIEVRCVAFIERGVPAPKQGPRRWTIRH